MTNLLRCIAVACLSAMLLTPAMAKGKTDQEAFRSLIDRYWATWSSGDLDKVGEFYDQAPNAVFFDVTPLKYGNWNEFKTGVKALFQEANSIKIGANDDFKVTRRGNLAWTTETFHMSEALKNGKTVEIQGRHTAVWEKRNGKWIILHEHVSVPMS